MNKRNRLPQIRLSDAQKEKLKAEIKAFYLDERGEEIGMIEQMQLLELFEQKMAPIIYNRALEDAKRWFTQMMDDLDSDYYALYKEENWKSWSKLSLDCKSKSKKRNDPTKRYLALSMGRHSA